ncbi:gb [Venturia nashicola]|uniref:Gb n=1 Tax=Venturia nashicola TaxID=86259 RepID=A0A4Z1NS84_9PEZI|nr:gb [Venturia nashicola]TLD23554.1 gb [Venturia nashicola]
MASRVTISKASTMSSNQEPEQLSSPPATPAPARKRPPAPARIRSPAPARIRSPAPARIRSPAKKVPAQTKATPVKVRAENLVEPVTPKSGRKRKVKETDVPAEGDPEELPHNLGTKIKVTTPARKKVKSIDAIEDGLNDPENRKIADKLEAEFGDPEAVHASPPKSAKKAKASTHTPGLSPFPDHPYPTPEQCIQVERILSTLHGPRNPPAEIPKASLTVAGCGEVPHVLDALIRTRLSAATTGKNSSMAFQGLVDTFRTVTDAYGRESVDWNAVRLATQPEVKKAIESGGLSNNKSKDIKAILDLVYAENQARSKALLASDDKAPGEENESDMEKKAEISRAEDDILSLDHLHLLPTNEAFDKLVSYPGIGDKTASCVLLFCLRRPSFAVDTHVFRLCKWLGWVPPKASRNQTFSHCEVRVPNNLKYPLHQLLIAHGKECPRCRANTGPSNADWDKGCVIEELVTRTEARKTGEPKTPKGKGVKGGKKAKKIIESQEEDESELSELEVDEMAEE